MDNNLFFLFSFFLVFGAWVAVFFETKLTMYVGLFMCILSFTGLGILVYQSV